jgi:1-pyrroline-5-carboxylate dehydrogenase
MLLKDIGRLKIGPVEDFNNFVNAVIDEKTFDKLSAIIDHAMADSELEIIAGGSYDKSKGYFVQPTIITTKNPVGKMMTEEFFGPILTVYVYPDEDFDRIFNLIDTTSKYALTGAIIANDRSVIARASDQLRNSAGNFYINDKCTGAVVGQQPFGGGRGSGTNDKAGSFLNLLRWVSPRAIKETFNPPTNYRYPVFEEEISLKDTSSISDNLDKCYREFVD